MDDDMRLPEGDSDLEFARRIGDRIERGLLEEHDGETGIEGFFDALLAFKKQTEEHREKPSQDASYRVWARVDATTQVQPGRLDRGPAKRSRRTRKWVWAAAAALAVAGIIALLTQNGPDVTLVVSAESEVVRYTWADGSVVTLRPYSDLYLLAESAPGTTFRIRGEAFFDVAPQNDDGVFAVEGGDGRVEVLGTRFNVNTWSTGTTVYLEEGKVRFIHRQTGDEVVLQPGEWSRLTDEGSFIAPQPETADEHLDWLEGEMNFRQQPAALVAAELEQHFALTLEIPAPIRNETLSGRILLDDHEQSLDDLSRVMGGRFVVTGPNSYRFVAQ